MSNAYELYRHELQASHKDVDGRVLESHLRETGFINRALTLESEIVQSWLTNPSTYPHELREIMPVLWGDIRIVDSNHQAVSVLCWSEGYGKYEDSLNVSQFFVEHSYYWSSPALLKPTE